MHVSHGDHAHREELAASEEAGNVSQLWMARGAHHTHGGSHRLRRGKLPQVGGALGKGIREFRRGKSDLLEDEDDETESTEPDAGGKLTQGNTGAR